MMVARDWLWDRNLSLRKARSILKNPSHERFINLAGLLLSRKNTPKEVFRIYIKPNDFLDNWNAIKRQMRKDEWNNPRIEFWQAIYEKLGEKYGKQRKVTLKYTSSSSHQDELVQLIAGKIKAVRKQKGLTQSELAKKLKISQQVISRIESGGENISLLTLKKIVVSLGAKLQLEIK